MLAIGIVSGLIITLLVAVALIGSVAAVVGLIAYLGWREVKRRNGVH